MQRLYLGKEHIRGNAKRPSGQSVEVGELPEKRAERRVEIPHRPGTKATEGTLTFTLRRIAAVCLCLTLCNTMDCSLPGSSVCELSQARILEWVAIFFSRGSSQPRDRARISRLTGRFFPTEPLGKPHKEDGKPHKDRKLLLGFKSMSDRRHLHFTSGLWLICRRWSIWNKQ